MFVVPSMHNPAGHGDRIAPIMTGYSKLIIILRHSIELGLELLLVVQTIEGGSIVRCVVKRFEGSCHP